MVGCCYQYHDIHMTMTRLTRIKDVDLPKKPSETGVIRRMFLDPTASHLLVCTTIGDNYYLHSQSKTPKPLGRLRGVTIESVAWNPLIPTSSTREIIVGAADGTIYEAFFETGSRKDVKHCKVLQKLPDGPIAGIWVDNLPGQPNMRRIMIATATRLFHLVGSLHSGHDGSVYTRLFEHETPIVHELTRAPAAPVMSALVVSPNPPESNPHEHGSQERVFAWLSSQGVFHGKLLSSPADQDLGKRVFAESKLVSKAQITNAVAAMTTSLETGGARRAAAAEQIDSIALTQWHIVHLVGGRVVVTNRLTGAVVHDQVVLSSGERPLGLSVDIEKNTLWLFTTQEIFEVVVRDEDRHIWEIMLGRQQFDAALEHAHTQTQREMIATAHGDALVIKGQYMDAAAVYGRSSKPFEEVVLSFIDHNEPDALRKFLMVKLATTRKAAVMQRVMMASWLVEIFMAKLNSLEDMIITQAELAEHLDTAQSKDLFQKIQTEYRDFVARFRYDLDKKTVYDIISSHGREEELLYFADVIDDHDYTLAYWVQRERWPKVLDVLKKQTDPTVFYRYSTVLMTNVAVDLVDILMRHSDLEPRKLIPALLEYNRTYKSGGPGGANQAIRYLLHAINQLGSRDAAVHNTLISIFASGASRDEAGLLNYLEAQGDEPRYDPDFALRLCIQHHRTLSCVHIYTSMGQYAQAVDLALSHNEVDLAASIADRPLGNITLRKKLWLSVARKVISQSDGIRAAIEFLKRCGGLVKIEDLIPFFPDFVVIDDFKDEICTALESYSASIDQLKREMDESAQTAATIKTDISALRSRYAIVEPGEKCHACTLPLLSRQFFVFPCQHSFHSDCLARRVLEQVGKGMGKRIRELQAQISKGVVGEARREGMIEELDGLVASAW